MAAGRLPEPGTEYGPCAESCNHIDCLQTRSMVAAICSYCQEQIGYETRFYNLANHGQPMNLVHAACHEEAIEKERANQ